MRADANWAIIGIFLFMLIQALAWSADFLTPITAAVLGYLTVGPFQRRLSRLGVPSVVTAIFVILTAALGLVYILLTFAEPTADLLDDLPRLIQNFSNEVSGRGGAVEKLNEAAAVAQDVLTPERESSALEVRVVASGNFIAQIMGQAPAVVGQIVFALILLFFLISSGDLFITKIVECFGTFEDKRSAVSVVKLVEKKLGHYLGSIVLINACLGVIVAIAMYLWGLPNPEIFGFVAFSLNFIPFLGAIGGAAFAALATFSVFDELWSSIGVFLTYMALTNVEGQFITPKLLSNRLKLNTTVVFIAVAFFAWIWSVIGMIIAVPILIVAKIILDEIEATQRVGAFLGGAADP